MRIVLLSTLFALTVIVASCAPKDPKDCRNRATPDGKACHECCNKFNMGTEITNDTCNCI